MADIPLDRMLQAAGVLDKKLMPITDESMRKEVWQLYEEIIEILRYYCSIKEEYYSLIALWIIGAVNIQSFNTYPYLFLNAMKGSGKTRLLKLITKLSGGDVLNSLTEAVLFRTEGALGIDEFEGINRKGSENLKELLNSAYKKGTKVKRMRKIRNLTGSEELKVEEFDVYRPIVIANIYGMDEVLGDRCIKIVVDKSNDPVVTKKIERFDTDEQISKIRCSLCGVVAVYNVYKSIEIWWNNYITSKYNTTYTTLPTYNTLTTLPTLEEGEKDFLDFFNKVDESNLNGRVLELAFPLLFTAYFLGEDVFKPLLLTFKEIEQDRKESDTTESFDVSIIDFIAQEPEDQYFRTVKEITIKFKEFMQSDHEWLNERWVGRALKRLNLIKQKRRLRRGIEVILDVTKAQEKMRMFR